MGRFINPFTDWGFKKIFGQEANKEIIIFFLNELFRGELEIKDLEFLDKEQLGENEDDRCLIYDIYCKTKNDEYIIVEMQNKNQANFIDRSLLYMSRALVSQAHRGNDWRYKITAVYGVFFLNFKMTNALDAKLRTDVILADRETGRQLSKKLRMTYLQLPYFTKNETECENDFERLIYVLKKMEALERMPFDKKNFLFTKLAKIAEVRKLTEKERMAYDESLKKYWDSNNIYLTAVEEGRADGMAKGMADGMAKGMAKGMEKGMEKGKAEGKMEKSKEIATKMIYEDMPYDIIKKITGLPEEIVMKLMAECGKN